MVRFSFDPVFSESRTTFLCRVAVRRSWPALFRPGLATARHLVATIILVLALARSLAGLTVALLSGSALPVGMLAPPQSSASRTSDIQPDADTVIASQHLFGQVETGQPPPPTPSPFQ